MFLMSLCIERSELSLANTYTFYMDDHSNTAPGIEAELTWLARVCKELAAMSTGTASPGDLYYPQPPDLSGSESPYASFIKKHSLTNDERLVVALALAPHIQPGILRVLLQTDSNGISHSSFGLRKTQQNESLPTLATALHVIGGNDLKARLNAMSLLSPSSVLSKENILDFLPSAEGEPYLSSPLMLSRETFDLLVTGQAQKPRFGPDFPAQLLTTSMSWNDLVLTEGTQKQLIDIEEWLHHRRRMQEMLSGRYKPGYRSLFYGPPGTGKSLAATLLGQKLGMDVYRIDLSALVSKYIGETEKNLEKVFTKALNRDWILFFDEADALFGKRTQVSDSHDRYANQEVSYLLQRVEDYNGLIILASNFLHNMDQAFVRRFQSIVHFPMPGVHERQMLWRNGLNNGLGLGSGIEVNRLAKEYELSGSGIINVVHYCCQKVLGRGESIIQQHDLMEGIRCEFNKSGITV